MHEPDESERRLVGEKFRQLADDLRANLPSLSGRKKFTLYTDEQLRTMYPPRAPAPQSGAAE